MFATNLANLNQVIVTGVLRNRLPLDGAVRIELVEGVPIFRASSLVQGRIEALLIKQKEFILTSE